MNHPLRAAAAALAVSVLATDSRARAGEDAEAAAARLALDGDHRQAARGHRRRAHVRARRQRGRRRLRDARGDLDDVGRAVLGRRDAGAHLQPEDREDHRDQRARRRADRRDARVLPAKGLEVPAGGRAALRGDARHARRAHHDARRVRQALARRGARAVDHARRRLRDRRRDRGPHRGREGQAQAVAVREGGDAAARRARRARRRSPARSSARPTSPRRSASSSRPKPRRSRPASRARKPCRPPTTASTAATSPRNSCAARRDEGAQVTSDDLANWRVKLEEPRHTTYRGIDVYKLDRWTQGPVMLQALNVLENFDLKAMGYNSANYIHTVYQAMNLAFADRDFYYGDPVLPARGADQGPALEGLREEARGARENGRRERCRDRPRRPVSVPGRHESLRRSPEEARSRCAARASTRRASRRRPIPVTGSFYRGTTSVVAADKDGWLVSMTPSGGWLPAVIAGRTGIGMSQRAQMFVTDPAENPFNVDRARQAPARDADALARVQGRQALARLRRAGRRHAGPEPAAVLPERRRVRHDAAAGGGGAELHQLADARLVRRARELPGAARAQQLDTRLDAPRPQVARLRARVPLAHLRPDQRDPASTTAQGTFWGGSSNHGEDYGIAW